MANANLAFSKETLQHLAELSELTKQPAQALAEKLLKEAIELEIEDFLVSKISDERDVEGAETVDFEDIKWDYSIIKLSLSKVLLREIYQTFKKQ